MAGRRENCRHFEFVNKNPLVPIEFIKIKMSFTSISRSIIFQVFFVIILILFLAEYIMFSYLSKRKLPATETKHVRDYETILCRLDFNDEETIVETSGVCPVEGIVTSFKHWSLSKNMWVYANVIALSVATTLKPYVPFCLRESLSEIFENLSIPILTDIGHCVVPLSESVGSIEEWEDASQSIVVNENDLYTDTVLKYIDLASREFVFGDGLKYEAQIFLTRARRSVDEGKTVVYVAVHITRTNIILNQEYDDVHPSVDFFFGAMNYFRSQYDNVIFVVIADREDIWQSIFKAKDIFIVGEESLNEIGAALSILSHCNHTILSSSGTAVWAAILAGGQTVLSFSLSEEYHNLIKYYDRWIFVTNESHSKIEMR